MPGREREREIGAYDLNGDDLKGIYMSSCREGVQIERDLSEFWK